MSNHQDFPQDLSAERAALGAVLVDSSRLEDCADFPATAFYRKAHRDIYAAMEELSRRGVPPDFVTLQEELGRRGLLEEVGGPSYLASLSDGMPRAANIRHYLSIIREKWALRQLMAESQRVLDASSREASTAAELCAEHEARIVALSSGIKVGSGAAGSMPVLMAEAFARYEERTQKPGIVARGARTGFAALDEMVLGWRRNQFIVVGGLTSTGKSSFALQTGLAAARHGATVHVFSLEMSRDEVTDRAVSMLSGIPGDRLETGFWLPADYKRFSQARIELETLPVTIDDTPGIRPRQIQQLVRARERETGRHTDLVIVDYMQLAEPDGRADSRQMEVSSISRALKGLSSRERLDTCVLALAQLNRSVDGRPDKRPRLSDLRESGSLEQDANAVILLWRPDEDVEEANQAVVRRVTVDVRKNRGGRRGYFDLFFDGPTFSFREDRVRAESAA